jgi:hypothetical protein
MEQETNELTEEERNFLFFLEAQTVERERQKKPQFVEIDESVIEQNNTQTPRRNRNLIQIRPVDKKITVEELTAIEKGTMTEPPTPKRHRENDQGIFWTEEDLGTETFSQAESDSFTMIQRITPLIKHDLHMIEIAMQDNKDVIGKDLTALMRCAIKLITEQMLFMKATQTQIWKQLLADETEIPIFWKKLDAEIIKKLISESTDTSSRLAREWLQYRRFEQSKMKQLNVETFFVLDKHFNGPLRVFYTYTLAIGFILYYVSRRSLVGETAPVFKTFDDRSNIVETRGYLIPPLSFYPLSELMHLKQPFNQVINLALKQIFKGFYYAAVIIKKENIENFSIMRSIAYIRIAKGIIVNKNEKSVKDAELPGFDNIAIDEETYNSVARMREFRKYPFFLGRYELPSDEESKQETPEPEVIVKRRHVIRVAQDVRANEIMLEALSRPSLPPRPSEEITESLEEISLTQSTPTPPSVHKKRMQRRREYQNVENRARVLYFEEGNYERLKSDEE